MFLIKPLTRGPYNSIHFLQILCEPSHCWKSKKNQTPKKKQLNKSIFLGGFIYNWGGGGRINPRLQGIPQVNDDLNEPNLLVCRGHETMREAPGLCRELASAPSLPNGPQIATGNSSRTSSVIICVPD